MRPYSRQTIACFNPCFCGTRARTVVISVAGAWFPWFQSLFLWNSRPDGNVGPRDGAPLHVSILVFVELAPGRKDDPGLTAVSQGFNPCFCGTRARTRGRGSIEMRNLGCFNPCFCGTRARTGVFVIKDTVAGGFQSLFLWNSRPDFLRSNGFNDLEVFQSLFLWNSRPDPDSIRRRPGYGPSFNPCFCGTRARTAGGLRAGRPDIRVSILVFVELAPGLSVERGQVGPDLRFNPCFCGTRARTL